MKKTINEYISLFNVVHISSHGQYQGGDTSNSFILTWNEKFMLRDFQNFFQSEINKPVTIELLVLGGCESAIGDNKYRFGFLGVALAQGVKSALGSLWLNDDEGTATLMIKFYEELARGDITKAEALRRAQLSMLQDDKFAHPYFWSSFVLMGNWY